MTDKANPSVNRPIDAFETAGAIAYGGSRYGFVVESDDPTPMSVQDSSIDDAALNEFDATTSPSTLDVTIDPGEAIVFGSWIVRDTETTVTLAPNEEEQVVYVGWNKNGTDDVIVGLEEDFAAASGDADAKIDLWTFDTDGVGVDSVVDERSIGYSQGEQTFTDDVTLQANLFGAEGETIWDESQGYIPAAQIEQGPGSGLDADTVDGFGVGDITLTILDNGVPAQITASNTVDFRDNISVSQDPNTGNIIIDGLDKYTDGEAVSAVEDDGTLNINITGNADEVDGYDIQKDGSDGIGIINFKT